MWIRRCIEVDLNPLYSLQRKDSDSRSVLNDDLNKGFKFHLAGYFYLKIMELVVSYLMCF